MMRFNGVCAYSKKGVFDIGFCESGVSPAVDPVVNNEKSGVGARDVFCDCDVEESVVFVSFDKLSLVCFRQDKKKVACLEVG